MINYSRTRRKERMKGIKTISNTVKILVDIFDGALEVGVRGHLHFYPGTAWQPSRAALACLLVILKHTSLAPILLTLTLKDVYNVEYPSRSLILISEDSPGGELYPNCKL